MPIIVGTDEQIGQFIRMESKRAILYDLGLGMFIFGLIIMSFVYNPNNIDNTVSAIGFLLIIIGLILAYLTRQERYSVRIGGLILSIVLFFILVLFNLPFPLGHILGITAALGLAIFFTN